jgi:hypothetical protein
MMHKEESETNILLFQGEYLWKSSDEKPIHDLLNLQQKLWIQSPWLLGATSHSL